MKVPGNCSFSANTANLMTMHTTHTTNWNARTNSHGTRKNIYLPQRLTSPDLVTPLQLHSCAPVRKCLTSKTLVVNELWGHIWSVADAIEFKICPHWTPLHRSSAQQCNQFISSTTSIDAKLCMKIRPQIFSHSYTDTHSYTPRTHTHKHTNTLSASHNRLRCWR